MNATSGFDMYWEAHDAAVMWRKWRLVAGKELYDLATDAGQKTDVAAQHPHVATRLRAYYERWWAKLQPALAEQVDAAADPRRCRTALRTGNR